MDGHKTKDAKPNIYSVALLISSPPETTTHLPPKSLSRVYPLYRAVSTPCRLAKNSKPPDLLRPPLMPSGLSLPTRVETSPRSMVTRNCRVREWSMPASEPHQPPAKLDCRIWILLRYYPAPLIKSRQTVPRIIRWNWQPICREGSLLFQRTLLEH